jgi:hypothetical protein
VVLAARGGAYAPGTPREGWDHAEQWLPHGLALTGLVPRFITAELTLADVPRRWPRSSRWPRRASRRPSAPSTASGSRGRRDLSSTELDSVWPVGDLAVC